MVDVKLDVGDSPSLKAAFKKKSEIGICGVLMYVLFMGALTVLTLDAAELISLGVVKNVMGLKVMKAEEFTNLTVAFAAKDQQLKALSSERDGLRSQVTQLTNDCNQANTDKQNQINALTGERDTVKGERDAVTGERDTLKKQVDDLTMERDQLKKKVEQLEEDKAAKTAEDEVKK